MNANKLVLVGCGGAVVAAVFMVVPGCDDKRRHQASEEVEFAEVAAPVPADAPPDQVAAALLDALKELQITRRSGLGNEENRQRYDKAMAVILSLAAGDRIHEQVRKSGSRMIPKDISKSAALRTVVVSWTSIIAHYVDGFLMDTITPTGQPDGDRTVVRIQAENPADRKLLAEIESSPEVANAKDKDGTPLPRNSPEYLALIRPKALERGIGYPIRAQVSISLWKVDGAWRVSHVSMGPGPSTDPGPLTVSVRTPSSTVTISPTP